MDDGGISRRKVRSIVGDVFRLWGHEGLDPGPLRIGQVADSPVTVGERIRSAIYALGLRDEQINSFMSYDGRLSRVSGNCH
jgi:hypothetical protein